LTLSVEGSRADWVKFTWLGRQNAGKKVGW